MVIKEISYSSKSDLDHGALIIGGWPVKEEVRSKLRTCGEGRTKEEGRLLPMLEDVKKEDSCGRARESGRARRG